tara:strand:- start:720 stop:1637 length:918 start_codon:yes stop_codon:yes gene_type:complete
MSYNIVFMGTPEFSVPTLKTINKKFKIQCVFTQPARKSNRGYKLTRTPVHICADKLGIIVKTPEKIIDEHDFLKSLNFDLAIVVAYGQLIPKEILSLSKKGFINIHASLLPKWRGAAPIQRSILNNDKITGISFMKMKEKLDAGPICSSYSINILNNENSKNLSERLSILSSKKVLENIDSIISEQAIFKEQNEKLVSYAKKINKNEGKIDWNNPAEKILFQINALNPKPGAWFSFQNIRFKILSAEIKEISGKVGEVIDDELTISCGKNSIKINTIQKEGKKPQLTKEFLYGNKISKGTLIYNV